MRTLTGQVRPETAQSGYFICPTPLNRAFQTPDYCRQKQ